LPSATSRTSTGRSAAGAGGRPTLLSPRAFRLAAGRFTRSTCSAGIALLRAPAGGGATVKPVDQGKRSRRSDEVRLGCVGKNFLVAVV
jgi:hypothetical protein